MSPLQAPLLLQLLRVQLHDGLLGLAAVGADDRLDGPARDQHAAGGHGARGGVAEGRPRLGLCDEQISRFLVGPAYLPFGWMGCIDGWGGPLPQSWIDRHTELEQKILPRQRELGMTPVLQGFTGHVPEAVEREIPAGPLPATAELV